MIAALVAAGEPDDVATCVAGLGGRELGFDLVLAVATGGADVDEAPVGEVDAALVDEIIGSCRDAVALLAAGPEVPERLALSDEPFELGDDPRLDFLWQGCESGDGRACDRLWEEAPIGSRYEEFGVTCGDRLEILDCTAELVVEPEPVDGDANDGDGPDAD